MIKKNNLNALDFAFVRALIVKWLDSSPLSEIAKKQRIRNKCEMLKLIAWADK